jgi:hypothetical protein
MNRLTTATSVALTVGLTALIAPTMSRAAVDPANPCAVAGWYVNPDEADRAPERTTAGFVFDTADLIHHAAPPGLTTADLDPGDYTSTPLPDQPSFFSVEVAGPDGGYATLRYNRLTHWWEMVTGGQLYTDKDPDVLVDMPPVKRSHIVVSFGVGYTKNPPGTVKTTVSAVQFQGKAYTLSCPKPVDPSPTATSSPSTSTSPTQTASPTATVTPSTSTTASAAPSSTRSTGPTTSTTTSAAAAVPSNDGSEPDDSLPVTGVGGLVGLVSGGVFLAAVGGILAILARRRRRA